MDLYKESIKQIIECIPNKKFECSEIKSPIKELKKIEKKLILKQSELSQSLNVLKQKRKLIMTKIKCHSYLNK